MSILCGSKVVNIEVSIIADTLSPILYRQYFFSIGEGIANTFEKSIGRGIANTFLKKNRYFLQIRFPLLHCFAPIHCS